MFLKKVLLFSLVFSAVLVEAREFPADKDGNVNINVIDRKVMVGNKVVDELEPKERIGVNGMDVGVDDDEIGVNSDEVGVNVDDDEVSVKTRNGVAVDVGDDVSVNMGGLIDAFIGDDD